MATPPQAIRPERILIIRPSALGDVCRSVPAAVSLRQTYPAARIDWLVQDSFADAVRFHPDVTAVVPFARGPMGREVLRGKPGRLGGFLKDLRGSGYDLVYDFQGLARSGAFAWATRAPRRVGYADARELGWLGLNERHDVPRDMHTVDRMLALLRASGVQPVPDLRLNPGVAARQWLAAREWAGSPYAVIAPTSRWPGKRWPDERFAAVARGLLERGLSVILVGSTGERDQCGALLGHAKNEPRLVDLLGATSVATLMAVIEGASLVVACDSAALHMAVGFDRPIVALFGPTRVDRVGPYKREADVVQHVTPADHLDHKDDAAGRAIMERITEAEVLAAALARIRA
ncbi:MAG: glycosyltransferase family 9 protein [Phycisphaerales bacterium]|nr:glycosyltransferase family 9 protein [Phycisphaerales bacterium]